MSAKETPMLCQEITELDRLLVALDCQTQMRAAALLNIRQSKLSDCKRRGGIVSGDLLENALTLGIRQEWIKQGEKPMKEEYSFGKKCELGRYCLESCPALEAAQKVVSLIVACSHICEACKYRNGIVLEYGCGKD